MNAKERKRQRAVETGKRIRAIREAKRPKMTQQDLAQAARMERTDISNVETGKLSLGPERLARVAAALKVSVLELQPEAETDELGLTLLDRQEELEGDMRELTQSVQRLTRRVTALERLVRSEEPERATGGR